MGSFSVLDLGLFGVGIDGCWNFNDCGDFCGGVLGSGLVWLGELKVAQNLLKGLELVGLVVVGRG